MNSTKSLLAFLCLVLATAFSAQAQAPNPPCCYLGDANGDGLLKASDLLEITKHLQGLTCMSEQSLCQSDVDGDGVVTNADLVLIREYILGLRDTFPRCGDLDGDGTLEWGLVSSDDLSVFLNDVHNGKKNPNFDADNDGDYDNADIIIFGDLAGGFISSFPGCACGEGACG